MDGTLGAFFGGGTGGIFWQCIQLQYHDSDARAESAHPEICCKPSVLSGGAG
jgi:hypothetical protein